MQINELRINTLNNRTAEHSRILPQGNGNQTQVSIFATRQTQGICLDFLRRRGFLPNVALLINEKGAGLASPQEEARAKASHQNVRVQDEASKKAQGPKGSPQNDPSQGEPSKLAGPRQTIKMSLAKANLQKRACPRQANKRSAGPRRGIK